MDRPTIMLLGAVCTGALVTTAIMAPAQATDRTARTDSHRVIELDVGNDKVVHSDVGKHGLSIGDEFIYTDLLSRDGHRVGKDGSSCQVTDLEGDRTTTSCVLSVQLPDGQLTAQSLWTKGSSTVRMAITGGTDAYRGASGELTCRDIQTPHETYRISLD
ncbi:allene oxide cyclase barrel-like domain-containing protein [Streptomyces sp. NBC_00388]|uniref:allene oxide cyclase barrel-like domain-containing protein n=1 Tax=Streptomyces sp. NBC_00388 TaxID=2975735 RepID=UPI002E210C6B